MNRGLPILVLSLFLSIVPAVSAQAAATGASSNNRPQTVLTNFTLRVTGHVERGTTFWVAYGPVAGRFGIIQLRETSVGVYAASRSLPTAGRAVFTYLAGQGAVKSRMGLVPGNPVTTVKTVGPLSVWPHGVPAVRWQPPVG
jgi:hypothetical protein